MSKGNRTNGQMAETLAVPSILGSDDELSEEEFSHAEIEEFKSFEGDTDCNSLINLVWWLQAHQQLVLPTLLLR